MANVRFGHARTSNAAFPDQVSISESYGNVWMRCFRAKDITIANKLADCMVKACNNNVIGYSQDRRYTLTSQIANQGYDPSKATSTCYTDCAALVAVCCNYAGVPVSREMYTGSEVDCLLGSGQFIEVPDANNYNVYQRGDILWRRSGSSGHTAIVVSTNGDAGLNQYSSGSGYSTSTYQFKKYNLTQDKLTKIARLCVQEQGSIKGAMAEASLAANILETQSHYSKYGNDIYSFMRNSGWFANAAKFMDSGSATKDHINGVREVLVEGKRTLPLFVDEHDCLSDITHVDNSGLQVNKYDKNSYVQDTTTIRNRFGATYKFWCFPDTQSDPFGYTNEALRQQWNQYLTSEIQPGQSYGSVLSIDHTKLKPFIITVDRDTRRRINYTDLISNHGVIGVMIEGGYGTDYETFRNPKCYTQVEQAIKVELAFGYIVKSVARTTKDANLEMENLAFLVRKYPPNLGVWIEFGMTNNKKLNNSIMDVYQRELIRLGLKNKIGIKCNRKQLDKITWLNYQEDWYLWLDEHVKSTSELDTLIDPEFFDTDGESGPIRGQTQGWFYMNGQTPTTSDLEGANVCIQVDCKLDAPSWGAIKAGFEGINSSNNMGAATILTIVKTPSVQYAQVECPMSHTGASGQESVNSTNRVPLNSPSGQWNHICIKFWQGGRIKAEVDNTLIFDGTRNGSNFYKPISFAIECYPSGGGVTTANGEFKNVRTYYNMNGKVGTKGSWTSVAWYGLHANITQQGTSDSSNTGYCTNGSNTQSISASLGGTTTSGTPGHDAAQTGGAYLTSKMQLRLNI